MAKDSDVPFHAPISTPDCNLPNYDLQCRACPHVQADLPDDATYERRLAMQRRPCGDVSVAFANVELKRQPL